MKSYEPGDLQVKKIKKIYVFKVLIKMQIPSYERLADGKLIYTLEIIYKVSKKWKIEKQYSDFEKFHKNLLKIVPNVPYLPSKTILKMKIIDIEKRMEDLSYYMQVYILLCNFLNKLNLNLYYKNFIL